MKTNEEQTSDGLNQIFEIINAKGDIGELKEIVNKETSTSNENQNK